MTSLRDWIPDFNIHPMKPLMFLDSAMPKTYAAPVHPESGEVWEERFRELQSALFIWRHGEDQEQRDDAEAKYRRLSEGVRFRAEPRIDEHILILGAQAHLRAYKGEQTGSPRKSYSCHPETWDAIPEEGKEQFEVVAEGAATSDL